jgi:hypothetical protein
MPVVRARQARRLYQHQAARAAAAQQEQVGGGCRELSAWLRCKWKRLWGSGTIGQGQALWVCMVRLCTNLGRFVHPYDMGANGLRLDVRGAPA